MPIVPLHLHHEHALQRMLSDFSSAGEPKIPGYFPARYWPHARIVHALAAWSRGEEMDDQWVPCTTLFFERDGQLHGLLNFRHHLSPSLQTFGGHVGYSVAPSARGQGVATALLGHALTLAHAHGIPSVVLTCSTDNIASRRVIEKNGGALRDTYVHPEHGIETQRFDVATLA